MRHATAAAESKDAGVDHLFEALDRWSTRIPSATAVSAPDGTLDFAELARCTRSLASTLAANGVGSGTVVGLGNGRSRQSVSAWLAVWWLGATAVPIDSRFPTDRINFILRDAEASVLLTDGMAAGAVPAGVRTIRPTSPISGEPVARARIAGDDCAYLIYTSGTTGWPKGAEITYAGLGTFLSALDGIGITPGGLGANPLSPGFDGWLWCTLMYLLHGQGTAIIDLADGDTEHPDLAARIAAVAPRTVCLTPSLLATCVDSLSSVDTVIVAGEPCPRGLAERLAGRHRVLNVYGPTETTIAATWADSARGDDILTIGRPMPGYSAHVLDDDGLPVPIGITGELYIGGPAVARGYRNRPDLTDECFVSIPAVAQGDRLYRTGDLVTLRPDGLLEYLGRRDEQVKVRGFRVELREVEQVAEELGTVTAAAAFVHESGQTVGLAVVSAPGFDTDPAPIRDRCRDRLPEFMVPATIDFMTALPVTGNGKVDREELARNAGARVLAGRGPSTSWEVKVCEAWGDVLGQPIVDVEADFFELGGHSLLAARAVSALRERTGIRLSMRTLLAHPTPAALAKELGRLHSGKSVVPKARRPLESSWLVPWSHDAGRPAVVCIPPTGEGCGRFRQWQVELGDAVSVIGVQLPGRENRIADPHPSTLDDMVTAIASELTELLAPGQPLLVFGESYGGFIGYELTRRLGAAGRWPVALVLAASEPPDIRPEPERLVEHAKRVIARSGLDEDTQELVLALVRRDVELTRDYVVPADPGVATEVHIWGADQDELVAPERLDTWSTFLGTEVHRRHFTGGHVFVAEQGPAIAQLIGEILQAREVSC